MKERLAIVQLRASIFAPLNISFTPENFTTFSGLLLPESKAFNANTQGVIVPRMNPNNPQYGMPWRLFKKTEDGDINIVFLPGKVDIILTKDANYSDGVEDMFCNKCINWFKEIIETQGSITVNRIAYAPLYSIKLDGIPTDTVWNGILKKTVVDGVRLQDINLSFLLKREIVFNNNSIQMNLLHSYSDGMQIRTDEDGEKAYPVLLLQLDLNSIPEKPLSLNADGVKDFFNGILEVKDNLIKNVIE